MVPRHHPSSICSVTHLFHGNVVLLKDMRCHNTICIAMSDDHCLEQALSINKSPLQLSGKVLHADVRNLNTSLDLAS